MDIIKPKLWFSYEILTSYQRSINQTFSNLEITIDGHQSESVITD